MIALLPLADGDWIGVVVFIVIMIISAISQMAGNKKEAQPRPKPRPRPRPPVRQAQAGPVKQDPVASELEEFLRRAAGGGQQPARRPPPPPRPKPVAKPVIARPVGVEPIEAEVAHDLEVVESVADHVSHSVGESRFQSDLTRRREQSDQVSRKFDHQMGQLDSSPRKAAHEAALAEPDIATASAAGAAVESMPDTAAAGLAAMLASPTSLRQAILLKEILDRPEHRWS